MAEYFSILTNLFERFFLQTFFNDTLLKRILRQKRLCLVPPPLPKTTTPSHQHQYQRHTITRPKQQHYHQHHHQVDLRSLNRFHNLIDDENNNIAACLKRDMCRRFRFLKQ